MSMGRGGVARHSHTGGMAAQPFGGEDGALSNGFAAVERLKAHKSTNGELISALKIHA